MAALSVAPEPEPEPELHVPYAGKGIIAVVLYDYEVRQQLLDQYNCWKFWKQATEDNEMHLIEGEYIEQIEEVDEGWWSGVGPGGKAGLFPCVFFISMTLPSTHFTRFSSKLC
jgi:hypothetical protein